MKTPTPILILACAAAFVLQGLTASPISVETPTRTGAIFAPTKSYRIDEKVSLIMKNCTITEIGQILANLTRREVLVSEHVMWEIIPDIEINDTAEEVERVIMEKMKAKGIRIGQLGPHTLVCFSCPEPLLNSAFELK